MAAPMAVILFLMILTTLFVLAVQAQKRAVFITEIATDEMARHEWETSQDNLSSLVWDKKLSTKSETYRRLHRIQTKVLTEELTHREVAQLLRKHLLSDKALRAFKAESDRWPHELEAVFARMTAASGLVHSALSMNLFYSNVLRWMLLRTLERVHGSRVTRSTRDEVVHDGMGLNLAVKKLQNFAALTASRQGGV
jgi:hypothetical protein